MHIQLPAILKCTWCGRDGLKLAAGAKIDLFNKVETVVTGAVDCPKCGSSYPVADGILNFLPVRTPNIGLGQRTNQTKLVAWGYERFWRPKALTALGQRPWPPEEELATILKMLTLPDPTMLTTHNEVAFWLDQGCSTCFYGRAIARAIHKGELPTGSVEGHVVAVDNSWPMLQEARGFVERDGLTGRLSLVRADVEQLPFIEAAFCGVASGGSLNEFQHTDRALAEARRTLARSGRGAFMVQMHSRQKPGGTIQDFVEATSGIKFFELERLNAFYKAARFQVKEQQGSGLITISQLAPYQE